MTTRVRFAPSPTGYLHIGGARTALYNYIFAKASGGKYILRIEDTDRERSTKEFEQSQIDDMAWLGLTHDEGPGVGGPHAPYHQFERTDIYKKYTDELLAKGLAFYDFCSDEELAEMARKNKEEGTPPYTGKWRDEANWEEARQKIAAGEVAPVRFKVPDQDVSFKDHVRGDVKFPKGMVGDFVIYRSNGVGTYNFCNVIDDHLFEITHVIRGEDHVNNTLRQVLLYQAFGWDVPEFAHVSLLIGADRQKLSKRHGATSVKQYREQGYLPEALANYLCLLGWSHPEEKDVFTIDELKDVFSLTRFSKSHAIYDVEKLKYINGQHIKQMETDELLKRARPFIAENSFFHDQSVEWQKQFIELYKDKIQLLPDLNEKVLEVVKEDISKDESITEVLAWETTPKIKEHIETELNKITANHVSAEIFSQWMDYCKKELGIKGKPLFMGFRVVLTGQNHGPDLKVLIPLTPIEVLKKRIASL
ncbi:MAG: glutamate--tRNA ligase [Halobacteriovoraceae bacterium]|nr:glutamate--tRNA ligase [Halobacteriovoraceae bacterium]|tara:strand:+ start:409 stop:1839 length:1431 start_codon:yes stop_codon:yes gene_type:complete